MAPEAGVGPWLGIELNFCVYTMGTCFVTPPTTLNTLTVVTGESWPGLVDAISGFKSMFCTKEDGYRT